MNYYLLTLVFFYFCFRVWGIFKTDKNWLRLIKLSGYFLIFIAVGFLMSAILYLPFYKYIPFSPRGGEEGRGYQFATSWSMPPEETINLAVPDFSGTSVDQGHDWQKHPLKQGPYWGRNPFKLHSEYLGSTVVCLFFLTLFCCRKNKLVLFFLIMGLLSFTVAWGGSTPLFKLYYNLVPGFKKFRAPSLIFFLIAFSAVVISAHGLHYLIEQVKSQQNAKRIIKFLVIFALIVIGLSFLISIGSTGLKSALAGIVNNQPAKISSLEANFPKFIAGLWKFVLYVLIIAGILFVLIKQKLKLPVAGILIALLTIIDLWMVESKHVQAVAPPEVYFAPDEVVQALQNDNSLFRILPLQYRNDNYPMLFNLQSVAGEHGNQLQRYNEFVGAGKTSMVDYHNIFSNFNFLNLSNAKYLITQQPTNYPTFKEIHKGRFYIYENLNMLPRSFVVPKFEVISESDKILQHLGQPDFNPRHTVILEKTPPLSSPADTLISTVQIADYQPMEVKIRAELDGPGFLILLDNYYPDWLAYVDGKETEIFRADYTFRAVALDSGQHLVEFRFVPENYYLGKRISLLSFIGVIAFLAGNFVLRRSRAKTPLS
jgi:succinate dehydrogenase hydrophobic anchor subunit